MPKSLLILHNPTSGRRRRGIVEALAEALRARGASVEIYGTKGPDDACHFLRQVAEERSIAPWDVVVAAGGDGTINEVTNGLVPHPGVALGVLPIGTTNVFARELRLHKDPQRLAEALTTGPAMPIYPATVNGRRFVLMVGCGFDAWVVGGVDLAFKKRVGRIAYAVSGLRHALHFGKHSYSVTVGEQTHHATSLVVTKARLYGGSFVLAHEANVSAPQLWLVLFQGKNLWDLARDLTNLATGRLHRSPRIRVVTAQQAEIENINPGAGEITQIDGDPGLPLPVTVEVETTPLQVLGSRRATTSAT